MRLNLDVGRRAIAEQLQWLVNHQTLLIKARTDQDSVTWTSRHNGGADGQVMSFLACIDHVSRRLTPGDRWRPHGWSLRYSCRLCFCVERGPGSQRARRAWQR